MNKKFEFIQKLEKEDIVEYNQYMIGAKVGTRVQSIILGILSIGIAIYSLVSEYMKTQKLAPLTIVIGCILVLLGLFILIFMIPVMKWVVKKRILNNQNEIDPIKVTFTEDYLLYEFEKLEGKKEEQPYRYDAVLKAVECKDHIYLYASQYVVVIIKISACENAKEMIEFLKEKLSNRYFVKNKK